MKVIVCGSRGCCGPEHYELLEEALNDLRGEVGEITIISGGCKNSPDELAERYAGIHDLEMIVHRADWNNGPWSKNGTNLAGFRRNTAMSNELAEECLALWDGKSNGTLDMIKKAISAGTWVRIIPAKVSV